MIKLEEVLKNITTIQTKTDELMNIKNILNGSDRDEKSR